MYDRMFSRHKFKICQETKSMARSNDWFRIYFTSERSEIFTDKYPSKMINDGAKSDRGIRSMLS